MQTGCVDSDPWMTMAVMLTMVLNVNAPSDDHETLTGI